MTSSPNSHKVALITGGSQGLGFAAAKKLSAIGYQIVLTDILVEIGEEAAKSLNNASFYELDVSNAKKCHELVQTIIQKYKRIDILINSAGMGAMSTILSQKPVFNFAGNEVLTKKSKITRPLHLKIIQKA